MTATLRPTELIPAWHLYGEDRAFPDILHCEQITDRAAGLDWVIAPHRHPWLHQFFLVRSGGVVMTADGDRFVPDPPVVMTVPRGTVHGFSFTAGTDGYVVTIPLETLPDVFGPGSPFTVNLARPAIAHASAEIIAAVEALATEHNGRAPGRSVMLRARAATLAALILRALPSSAESPGPSADPRFRSFEELVPRYFREGWKLGDYASALGLSARHLGRLCRAATGVPAAAYIEAARLREACRLLVYTRAGVAEIGYQLGFDDPSYFSRVFRRHTGQTPRAYRTAFEQE